MQALKVLHADIDARVDAIAQSGWPCHKGCDYCCRSLSRQPVVTAAEWDLLAPRIDDTARQAILDAAESRVCPLLREGICTVYLVRPVACRTYGFYVDREGGLYCRDVAGFADANTVWGNGEAVEHRLDVLGPRRSLSEWVRTGR